MKETKLQTQSSADRITSSLSFVYQRKNKQTKTQHKSHPISSLYKPLDQPSENRNQKKKKFNLEAWEKETSNTVSQKIIIVMKRQRNATPMKEQTRNTEVQINEEEIGKLPVKEFR